MNNITLTAEIIPSPELSRREKISNFLWNCGNLDRPLAIAEKDAIRRGFLILWANQTADEKTVGTCHLNGRGFNGRDGKFAVDMQAGWERYGAWTERMYKCIAKMLAKYSRQIDEGTNK